MIVPSIFQSFPAIQAAVSTRGDVSESSPFGMNMSFTVGDDPEHVMLSRQQFFTSLGIDTDRLAIPKQIHSQHIQIIDEPSHYPDCDGLITRQKNLALVISVADCAPILFYDPQHHLIGAVHAGWRGTASRIAENAVQMFEQIFHSDPQQLHAFIGPSAGRCCYEVGAEVTSHFSNQGVVVRDGHQFLDLKQINFSQLLENGLQKQHIEVSSHCTICEPVLFHSYRRDKDRSGRMMATIVMQQ